LLASSLVCASPLVGFGISAAECMPTPRGATAGASGAGCSGRPRSISDNSAGSKSVAAVKRRPSSAASGWITGVCLSKGMESTFPMVRLLRRALAGSSSGTNSLLVDRLEVRVPAEDREAPAEDSLEEFLVDRLKGVAHIYEVYVEIANKIRVNMTFAKETAIGDNNTILLYFAMHASSNIVRRGFWLG